MLSYRSILNPLLLVSFIGSVLFAPVQRAWSAQLISSTDPQIAPAVAPEDAGAGQAWKLRLEFKELNLQLVGVATLADQASCFIKSPGASEQMVYAVGDVIGGYRITAIDSQAVTFDRQGVSFQLFLGQASGAEPNAAQPVVAGDGSVRLAAARSDVEVKEAEGRIKSRTSRFATAKLIEDASKLSKTPEFVAPTGKRRLSGRSLASSSFASPMSGELSSVFGYRRHPLGGGIRFHRGIDIAAPYGTPVKAAAAGRVVEVYNSSASDLGRHIIIRHNNEFETCYGHLSRITVSVGQTVDQGDVIGREGSSGSSTGPHLHFEIRRNKEAVNPLSYMKLR